MRPSARLTPFVLLVSIAAACGTGASAEGSYDLLRTTEAELPAVLDERGGCRYLLTGGGATLTAENEFTSQLLIRRECDDPAQTFPPDSVLDRGTRGTYELLAGDSVRFAEHTGRLAGYGAVRGDTLVIEGPRHTLVFLREEG